MIKFHSILIVILFPYSLHSEELQGEKLLFSPPNGYQISSTVSSNEMYSQEWILKTETIKDWSEMITVQVLFNYYNKGFIKNFKNRFIGIIVDVCEDGRGLEITSG